MIGDIIMGTTTILFHNAARFTGFVCMWPESIHPMGLEVIERFKAQYLGLEAYTKVLVKYREWCQGLFRRLKAVIHLWSISAELQHGEQVKPVLYVA